MKEIERKVAKTTRIPVDFTAAGPIRAIVASRWFPLVPQVVTLTILVLLTKNGLGFGLDLGGDELKTFRKTNLTTLAVWGLWWPAMIAVALAFGRAWCTVCPMELVNRIGDTVARRLGWPRARLGKLLRAGWMIVVLYLALQLLVAGVSIHRVPHFTAIMLIALVGGALLSGLVFREPRSFCRAFCPAGALLSVYGRYTPVQLETRDPDICASCEGKDCVRSENRYKLDKRSCPSLLRPYQRRPSDGCVMCLQCAKICPHDNMGVGIVSADAPMRRKGLLEPYEAAFVMLALGFVAHEVVGEVKWLDSIFHFVPERLAALLTGISFGWLEALWFLALFPAIVWSLISGIGVLFGHRGGLRSLLLAAATGAAPVVAVAHLAKAVAKLSSWGGFLPRALSDPQGVETFGQIADRSIAAPTPMLGLSLLGWVMLGLSLVVAWRALAWSRHVPAQSVAAAKAGLVGAAVLFSWVLTIWALPGL